MHGNYRHHYLLSAAAQSSPLNNKPASSKLRQQQQAQHLQHPHQHQLIQQQEVADNFNGLPAVPAHNNNVGDAGGAKSRRSQDLPANYQLMSARQQPTLGSESFGCSGGSQQFNGRHLIEQQQPPPPPRSPRASRAGEYSTAPSDEQADQRVSRHQQQQQSVHSHQQVSRSHNNHHSHQVLQSGQHYQEDAGDHDDGPDQDRSLRDGRREAEPSDHLHQRHLQQQQHSQQHHHRQQQQGQLHASQFRTNQQQQFQPQQAASPAGGLQSPFAHHQAQMQPYQHQNQQHRQHQQQHQQPQARGSTSRQPPLPPLPVQQAATLSSASSSCSSKAPSREEKPPHHVNFNRAHRATGQDDDEDEGESRKKKYLTAKYGQQQMNLIKKRLKIEMWLYEQLQELAKGSKSEAELDEIDVDLDQLLDMNDDGTRKRWLRKTLEPFEDLPKGRIDKFIDDVLEQSKLL